MAGYSLDQNLGLRFHHIRRASLPTMFALMFLSTAAALAQVSELPEPVVTWAGERPALFVPPTLRTIHGRALALARRSRGRALGLLRLERPSPLARR